MENERRLAKLRAVFPIPPPVDGLHQCKLDDVAWHCYTGCGCMNYHEVNAPYYFEVHTS